jgi:hypothetical protein
VARWLGCAPKGAEVLGTGLRPPTQSTTFPGHHWMAMDRRDAKHLRATHAGGLFIVG